MSRRKIISLFSGPLVLLLLEAIGPPESLNAPAFHVFSVTCWVAIWWISEAVPIAVTAMLPIVLFPLTGALELSATTASYGHKYIFLYVGGFLLAIAIEKWSLHRRIALNIIHLIGSNLKTIILGFMLATAFMSMWISNTATSVMMLPIGMAIISQFERTSGNALDSKNMGKALMIAIAYSASIGGVATLIGTPPNLVLAGILEQTYGVKISFFQWMKFGLPISIILLFICWKYLTSISFKFEQNEFPGGKTEISRMLKELGPTSTEERRVLLIFILTAVLWMSRSLLQKVVPAIDDPIIAMIAGISLFVIPMKNRTDQLLNWDDAKQIKWGIILLFGGGMALARGFSETGLAEWIALQLAQMEGLSLILLMLVLVAAVNFLTEITSNLATTAMLLPVLAPMALAFDLHPYMIMVSVTVAASCAFMLPVATPPNAVVFGSGYLRIPDMIRSGIWMNVISIVLVTVITYFLLPMLWEIVPSEFPSAFTQVQPN